MKLLLISSLFLSIVSSVDQCYDEDECADTTIENANVECDGYWACTSSSITTSEQLDCDGDNGCTFASIVAESGATVNALGYLGAYRAHIINEEGETYCNGAYGCYLADIIGNYVDTSGYYSAYQSAFTASSSSVSTFYYYNYGYQSGSYGDVVVTSDNELNLYYYGYMAGYRNYIDCESGSTCNLNCLGLGCKNTELFCYSGATCTYDCSEADECPTEYSIDSTIGAATGTKTRRRMLHANNEELKQKRKERHEFREKQRPIDEAKWAKKDPKFAEFMTKRNEKARSARNKRISNHEEKVLNSKSSFITNTNSHLVKDLTSRHILYGVGISSAIYFTLTLLWYFMYYKPRKGELYNTV